VTVEPEVAGTDELLRRHQIRYVVVGGQAVAREAATTTHDVDVMVATGDYATTLARLRGEKGLAFDWEDDQVARFRLLALGGVPLDVINPATFAGVRSGRDFFRYLVEEGSTITEGIAYATPEVVWYTRLLTKRWKAYAEKIVTNVIDGVDRERLGRVEDIARRFGTESTVRPRVAHVREELARPEVASLVGERPR
jgi:predicted nucleotidyltransferase